jgi:hypothetical protein
MVKINSLLKKMWMVLAILLCSVVSAQAANITYSLKTHVDGRTITGTANLAEGASLEDNMPQDLWRGYTTYKYYSDEALTQEITTAPAEDATVYVDYEFDPPFQMSNDNKTVWNYLRNYNGGGSSHRYVYYDSSDRRIYSQKNSPNNSSTRDYYKWAFYGDGYDFNMMSNYGTDNWLVWGTSNNRLALGAEPVLGWQIYANAAPKYGVPGGTVSFGIPETTSLIYLEDLGIALRTQNISSDHQFDSHNQLVSKYSGSDSQATIAKNNLWWYAFFASPTTLAPATPDIWHVTYKIQKADGTWYDDIVVQKRANDLTPKWPVAGFTPVDGYEYDYFYTDATFTEKFEGAMPNDCNTTLYIREKVIEYVSEPWKTLVIPFGIESLASFFGEDFEGVPAVDVLEFQNIEDGVITRVGDEDFYRCKLIFNPVYFIEAYKPYLIRLNRAYKSARDEMYAAEKGERDCEVTIVNDPANAGISVYMEGTLEDNGYSMDASDGLHFYFGYDDRANAYNFYRVSAQIPRNRCWFEVVDQRPAGAKLNVTFDMDAITGIGQVVSAKAADGRIYNINGQQVQGTFQKGIYIVNGKKVIVK